jgi:hypothetical protein
MMVGRPAVCRISTKLTWVWYGAWWAVAPTSAKVYITLVALPLSSRPAGYLDVVRCLSRLSANLKLCMVCAIVHVAAQQSLPWIWYGCLAMELGANVNQANHNGYALVRSQAGSFGCGAVPGDGARCRTSTKPDYGGGTSVHRINQGYLRFVVRCLMTDSVPTSASFSHSGLCP